MGTNPTLRSVSTREGQKRFDVYRFDDNRALEIINFRAVIGARQYPPETCVVGLVGGLYEMDEGDR